MTVQPVQPVIQDVWSRTAPKYRTRAIVLLAANVVLFGGLCCFMFWIRTGWYFPPTYEYYADFFKNTMNFASDDQITLYDLFMKPISLQRVPLQAVVIGLSIASLVSIPILIAILYRVPASIPFCVMVSFLAVMPWLGATLLLSCAIAAYGRLRLKFRFAAALLGLVPIGVYFFTASRGYTGPVDVLTPQMERGLVIAPLLLSGLASCALIAVVLTIARMVDYRPGAIAPLLAVMFLTPYFLFIGGVGRDELHYRFLELHYGPPSRQYFAPASVDAVAQSLHEASLDHLSEFGREQYRVAAECDKFLSDFPASRYVPCVLYIKGRACDMRVDITLFQHQGVLRFYPDFPNETSRHTWEALVRSNPRSPLASAARYRLAQLDARAGRVDQAVDRLTEISELHEDEKDREQQRWPLLAKEEPEASLEKEYFDLPQRAAAFKSLLSNNREPVIADAPLIAYLNCDPRHPAYHQNLMEILQRFADFSLCLIRDNIELELALAQPSPAGRIRKLEELRTRYPEGDTQPQILCEVQQNYLEQGRLVEARTSFDELMRRFPHSPFADEARRKMPLGHLTDARTPEAEE